MTKVWHVQPNPDPYQEKWEVQREMASRAAEEYDLKSRAIDKAKQIAKNNQPSQVVVHDRFGVIIDEFSYGVESPAPG